MDVYDGCWTNLYWQDIVFEEIAKASVFVEARHQPELHLIVRNINFGMTINNDGDGYDG